LLEFYRLPVETLPARLMREGLAALRVIVPYDAAWWGECSDGADGRAPRNWLCGRIDLGPDFAREWNRIGALDRYAGESMRGLGTAVCDSGYEDAGPAAEAFARRYDLYHSMAITRPLAGSGLLQFAALYRHRTSRPFEAVHQVLFEQFSAHLMQRWGSRVATLIGESGALGEGHGLVDPAGDFVYVGARLALLLHGRFPQWDGTRLPEGLTFAKLAEHATLKVGERRLAVERCGELLLLSLPSSRGGALLPPRELSVALLYANGRSHKDIAQETGLTPATVRTYLREAYLRLGVSDKIALGRALTSVRRRSRTPN
jgi:DNA-binding CsgD family transcriptional regulator